MMTKLSDTQAILLSSASQREDRSLLPVPPAVTAPKPTVAKSITALVERGFAEERESDVACVHRIDGDLRYGVFATAVGLAAIGIGETATEAEPAPAVQAAPAAPAAGRQTKSAAVIALLSGADGATMAELIAATSWLPHTTRAALTGFRKKGHAIERMKRGAETCYRITGAA